MFAQSNGILYKDGQPVIALGNSYYPSFHEAKFPVPPEGDRMGEMRKDLKHMAEYGFNLVRFAALGEVALNPDTDAVEVSTPLIDAMIQEAGRNGMASSIRLQGYVMNLRGHADYLMRNEKDEPMEKKWSSFMHSTMTHPGIVRDNAQATRAMAGHYGAMPGVVSYQIYNEPHYPANGTFDYHPLAIEGFRKWLEGQGEAPFDPPRARPQRGEDPKPWILWRLYSLGALMRFLRDSGEAAKAAAPDKETYTCVTSTPAGNRQMDDGVSYFDSAEDMDVMGITTYIGSQGCEYWIGNYVHDMAESAAALQGKHAWTIEVDARTHMPARKLHLETYSILGAGHKGIVYYEWRGDYPYEGTPLPDNCGFIFNSGEKTGHYDHSRLMADFVNRHSTRFARAEKLGEGVGLLVSEHAAAWADAFAADGRNSQWERNLQAYESLRRNHLTVSMLRAKDLASNVLGIRVLFVPCLKQQLSARERREIDAFLGSGGQVFCHDNGPLMGGVHPFGWWRWQDERLPRVTVDREFRCTMETQDALEEAGIVPAVHTDHRHLATHVLSGPEEKIVVLSNIDPKGRSILGARLSFRFGASTARFLSPYGDKELAIEDGTVRLPEIIEGGAVVLA